MQDLSFFPLYTKYKTWKPDVQYFLDWKNLSWIWTISIAMNSAPFKKKDELLMPVNYEV